MIRSYLQTLTPLLVLSLLLVSGCKKKNSQTETKKKHTAQITIATGSQPIGSLIYVAAAHDFFAKYNIAVKLQLHTSGKAALQSVLDQKADLALTSETPVMHAVIGGKKIYVLATIGSSESNMGIVARKDRKIFNPEDLAGKQVGVTLGTNGEFFLDVFLTMYDLRRDQVKTVHLLPEDMVSNLLDGSVDAVVAWNPHLYILQKKIENRGSVFMEKRMYLWTWNLVALQEFTRQNPSVIHSVIQALVEANAFLQKNRKTAQQIVTKATKTDPVIIQDLWPIYDFQVSLSQSLLLLLEDQSRWVFQKKGLAPETIPNFLNFVYPAILEEVSPEAVRLIYRKSM